MHVLRKWSLQQILLLFVKRPGHRNVMIKCKPAMSFESENTKQGNSVPAHYRVGRDTYDPSITANVLHL